MHIIIVTQYFWPETFRINELAVDLKNQRHQVTVLTGIPNYPTGLYFDGYSVLKKRRENYHGVNVVRVPLVARGVNSKLRLASNFLSFAISGMLLGPLLCREKYDLIFVYEPSPITVGLPALVLKKIKRIPIIFWVQDLWPESLSATGAVRSKSILQWMWKLTQFIYRGCDQILVQSKAFIAPIEKMGIPNQKIDYFPNAAEELFNQVSDRNHVDEKQNLPSGFRIVYAGNIGVAQSFETLLNAMIQLKNNHEIQWIIVGDGRQREWLQEQVIKHGLNQTVHLTGQKPIEEMPYYFGLADVLLVSLKKDPVFSLTIPSKLQSYLAFGKPVVASLDGEAAQIVIESGAGLASDAEDADSLVNNVLTLYNMPSNQREAMGKKGRLYFEKHFEKTELLNQLQRWMHKITEKK